LLPYLFCFFIMPNLGLAFLEVETKFLLDFNNKILPICMKEWEDVGICCYLSAI
jgi:hypothetical protein